MPVQQWEILPKPQSHTAISGTPDDVYENYPEPDDFLNNDDDDDNSFEY